VGEVTLGIGDVADCRAVELFEAASAGGVDGHENGPGDAAADEADEGEKLEVAQEEVGVEGRVVENVDVAFLEKRPYPIEPSLGGAGAALSVGDISFTLRYGKGMKGTHSGR
jgi:hypothetical protein